MTLLVESSNNTMTWVYYVSFSLDSEAEVQRGKETFSDSHSLSVASLELSEPKAYSSAHTLLLIRCFLHSCQCGVGKRNNLRVNINCSLPSHE